MKTCDLIGCTDFPCRDTNRDAYMVPDAEIDPEAVRVVMISEVPPADRNDYFYADGDPFYLQTTLQAFNDAGIEVSTMQEIVDLGVYATTAVKCGKTQYSISTDTIRKCSEILEAEVALFPNVRAFLLMGDVAIRAMNYAWKRQTGSAVVPSGSTYKIRKSELFSEGKRVFPSYVQTGKAYFIEKSKRRMIAEDIREAVRLAR
jgi:uracil-DNA glycosylase